MPPLPPHVVAVNLAAATALLSTGESVPVTSLLDEAGDETDFFEEATGFECGSMETGYFTVVWAFGAHTVH